MMFFSLIGVIGVAVAALDCSNICKFDKGDKPDCKILAALPGRLGSDLILWPSVPRACLDAVGLKSQAVDLDTLQEIFPNADGTNGNVKAYVRFLRFDGSVIASGFRDGWDAWFENGKFKAMVTWGEMTVDCSQSEGPCWTLFQNFLLDGKDAKAVEHMRKDGTIMYANARLDKDKEQNLIRINVCEALFGASKDDKMRADEIADPACAEIVKAVEEAHKGILKDAFVLDDDGKPTADVQCSSYGIGPGVKTCDAKASTGKGETTTGEGETTTGEGSTPGPAVGDDRATDASSTLMMIPFSAFLAFKTVF